MESNCGLADQIQRLLGDPDCWDRPEGYPASLALCIIDSLQSIGVRYGSVEAVVARYRGYRRQRAGDPNTDGSPELLATFVELGGHEQWAQTIGNKNRTYSRLWAPRKSSVIKEAAKLLSELGIRTAADLRGVGIENEDPVRAAWLGLPSQRSGISWHYVLMLAGVEGVKPDRMILRFLGKQLHKDPGRISGAEAVDILRGAAAILGVSTTVLDHRIWQHQSGRRPSEATAAGSP